ncbi:MAG: flagellar hook-basal body protein [Lachnospiraceae bacterium]|nr:flagellar hook-basal body protein [Lachnospiraceae bacterium]
MVKGLYTAYTGMINEQNRMDVLTHNLANADTTGYKKEGATSQSFDSVLAYKIKDTTDVARGRKIGKMSLGVKVGETYTDFSEGSMRQTDNTYDLALTDSGFFTVEFTNKAGQTSIKYTRDGSFTATQEGYLVTKDGDYVLDNGGRHIQVDPLAEVTIDRNGNIYQNGSAVAALGIADFEDYNYLEHYGENYYQPLEGATMKQAQGQVLQGYLEMANMQVVSEMVQLISVTRQYESNQKIIQTIDGSLEIAANQLGKV